MAKVQLCLSSVWWSQKRRRKREHHLAMGHRSSATPVSPRAKCTTASYSIDGTHTQHDTKKVRGNARDPCSEQLHAPQSLSIAATRQQRGQVDLMDESPHATDTRSGAPTGSLPQLVGDLGNPPLKHREGKRLAHTWRPGEKHATKEVRDARQAAFLRASDRSCLQQRQHRRDEHVEQFVHHSRADAATSTTATRSPTAACSSCAAGHRRVYRTAAVPTAF